MSRYIICSRCSRLKKVGEKCVCYRAADNRKGASERGYDWDWYKLRSQYLKLHPTCEICKLKPAEIVHHKVEIITDPTKRLSYDNLIAVCRSCHFDLHR